jgi:hypothetical protein
VVRHQQAAVIADAAGAGDREREQVHAVVVRAPGGELARFGHRGRRVPVDIGLRACLADGVAPGDEGFRAVAARHSDAVGHRDDVGRHAAEADAASRRRAGRVACCQRFEAEAAERGEGGGGERALHEVAAAGETVHHVADGFIAGRVDREVVVGMLYGRHGISWKGLYELGQVAAEQAQAGEQGECVGRV